MNDAHAHTASAADGSQPPAPPSGPPGHPPPGGQGRGGFWTSRPVLAVGLVLGLLVALGAPAALAGMIWGTIQRPLTGAVALGAMLVAGYRNRRIFLADGDTFSGRLLYTAIAGGMVGEAVTYLVFSLPPGAPTSAPWVLLFVVAIGGAIGVLFAIAGLMMLCGLITIWLLPWVARGVFGRHA